MKRATASLPAPDVREFEPHRRLMAAVLRTVVDDCTGSVHRRAAGHRVSADPQSVRDALAYMESADRAWPFSFENLCDALGMDVGSLRQELRRDRRVG